MAYASVAQLRTYLKQVPAGASEDALLGDILSRATAIIDRVLRGVTFGPYVSEARPVYADGSAYLQLPAHQAGSVTAVAYGSPATVIDTRWYTERGGALLYTGGSDWSPTWGQGLLWAAWRYSVTAAWGYGPVPLDVEEVCLELGVNIWAARDAKRFTNVVGVDGSGAVGYEGALTPQQKLILTEIRQQLLPQAI